MDSWEHLFSQDLLVLLLRKFLAPLKCGLIEMQRKLVGALDTTVILMRVLWFHRLEEPLSVEMQL